MKAMILAAGMGTRLKPLTNTTPKALMTIGRKTMLEIVCERLIEAGVTDIVINVHHHAEQMKSFIGQIKYPGVTFYVSEETDQLLDTGGGIKKARHLLEGDQAFFVHNIDVISDIDLGAMLNAHKKSKALATLAVSKREGSRYFLWKDCLLCGWKNTTTEETILCKNSYNTTEYRAYIPDGDKQSTLPGITPVKKAFSGIHIIEPGIFDLMTETGVFSITEVYLRLAACHPIVYFEHDHHSWLDIGTPEKLAQARERYADK